MDSYTAVGICEGFIESESIEQNIEAWQYLVDSGLVWTLTGLSEIDEAIWGLQPANLILIEGWFGREAESLIDADVCKGKENESDRL